MIKIRTPGRFWIIGLILLSMACTFTLLAACMSGSPAATPIPTLTPTSTLTPVPTLTPSPTATPSPTETPAPTETSIILNPAEMQTEKGTHGVLLEATGSYKGITQNVSVGITPDIIELLGGKGVEFNDEASAVPVGDRLAEASLRAWYAAYLQRNGLSESSYSFDTYIKDYKGGKDVTVEEWVYDPVTKTNSVMKVGPDTHVTFVSAEGMKWYGVDQVYFQGYSWGIVKAPDGSIIIVRANVNMSSDTNQEQILADIDAGIIAGLKWLNEPLLIQNGTKALTPNSKGPEDTQITDLVHPDFSSILGVGKCLFMANP